MGSSLSVAALGGFSPFPPGTYVWLLDAVPEHDREDSKDRPSWTDNVEKCCGRIGLVTGGVSSAEVRASCVAFVEPDKSVDFYVCREEWLKPLTDKEVETRLTDSDRALLDAFFYKALGEKVKFVMKEHYERTTESVFGPTGTIVRVRSEHPSDDGKETGVSFNNLMTDTLGVCGIVIQGALTGYQTNATFVVFPFPVGYVYAYSDKWLERVEEDSLVQEEITKLLALRKIVTEACESFQKEITSPKEDEETRGNDREEDLESLLDKLKDLRKALSEEADNDQEGAKESSNSCQSLNNREHDTLSENLANQLRESHQRELDLTRRLCACEARSNDLSALRGCLEQIEAKLDTVVAAIASASDSSPPHARVLCRNSKC